MYVYIAWCKPENLNVCEYKYFPSLSNSLGYLHVLNDESIYYMEKYTGMYISP